MNDDLHDYDDFGPKESSSLPISLWNYLMDYQYHHERGIPFQSMNY